LAAVALGTVVVTGRRRHRQMPEDMRPLHVTLAVALLVAATVAVVDFPMQRPTERALVFLLAGLFMSPVEVVAASDLRLGSWGVRVRLGMALVLLVFAVATADRMLVSDRLLWRAEGLEQYSHNQQADAVYRQAARHGADLFRVHQGLGRIALKQERFKDALEHARVAYEVFPDPAAVSLMREVRSRVFTSVTDPIETELTEKKP
jgi:tetratricopeptide (TPR) repeat protein